MNVGPTFIHELKNTTQTGYFLPQAVCRTKFRVAAMFGTSISLRPHEPSPLPRVSRPTSTAEIQL